MAIETEKPVAESKNDTLIREIREDYTYFRDYWRENHEEAKIDLRYVAGDPWDPEERRTREDNHRPVLCPDELDQYLNATINNLRQNPRGIKVDPKGDGATDANAEQRQAIIRNIEHDSIAQAAYTNAFSCAINCGMGFFRVNTQRTKKGSAEVEPRIRIISNPLSVLLDPNAKEADFSDQKRCFVLDVIRQSDFNRLYPNAQKQSFSPDDMAVAPDWFDGQNVILAEYWRIDGYDGEGEGGNVIQYITNGVEILETNKWVGSWIPIVPVLGKEVYVPKGGQMARMYYSMIRKARGAQMMLAYIASQEAEEYGMAPRTPFVGYVGQFETDRDSWDTLNKVPRSYVQVDPMVDQGNGQPLPLPTRPQFIPNAQAYEIGKESWRRSVQSAMGIVPLPTAAQRQNEKSGIALEKIQTQQSIGSYHFTANFELSLQNAGKQINELITLVLDTSRQIAGRNPNDTQTLLHVVPSGDPMPSEAKPEDVFTPDKGEFDVTISTGPSYQSQREAAADFADQLLSQMAPLIPVLGQRALQLIALAIKLRDVGPLGDEMADIISPQGDSSVPPQAQAMIQQAQQQMQLLQSEVQKLNMEKQSKAWEAQGKLQQIAAQHQADMLLEQQKMQTQIAVAEIQTKAQIVTEREQELGRLESQFHDQAHDISKQAHQHAHEQRMSVQEAQQDQAAAEQDAANASMQSAQDAAQSQTSAQPEQV